MLIVDLLSEIVNASEKAAEVARCIRKEDLFSILIQEKTGSDKSARFQMDFKTLADVLIQEMIRFDLDKRFPGIGKRIFGEESNQFTNTSGETVTVSISSDSAVTFELLKRVFDGNSRIAEILLNIITSEKRVETNALNNLQKHTVEVEEMGIWIDPIDSTFEYIHGNFNECSNAQMSRSGLPNVTVLVGVFSWSSGLPFMGVVNQPFHKLSDGQSWKGRVLWGINMDDVKAHFGTLTNLEDSKYEDLVLTSTCDFERLKENFVGSTISVTKVPGAGYKQLCVIDGLVGMYIIYNVNTYRWDCCGPHALLLSMGGGILRLSDSMKCIDTILNSDGETQKTILRDLQLTYKVPGIDRRNSDDGIKPFSNKEGLLVYKNEETLMNILRILKKRDVDER